MLIHIVPKLYGSPFADNVEIIDVSIPQCGLVLVGGKDITARRPYPNKRYLVACRKTGQKAIRGILVDLEGSLQAYDVITRWRVNGQVITHFVEHQVLDQDFDAASDDMTLWHSRYGTAWQKRWPDGYTEAPVLRQPCMDVLTAAMGGLQRTEDVRDVVDDDAVTVIMRVEPFKLHTIEPERILDERRRDSFRLPDIKAAFPAKPVVMPDMSIALTNGVTATLLLAPMPVRDGETGSYPTYVGDDSSRMPHAYLSFSREGQVLASKVPWGAVINGSNTYRINREVSLGQDDLYEIDSQGWDLMLRLGMCPTDFVSQSPYTAEQVITSGDRRPRDPRAQGY